MSYLTLPPFWMHHQELPVEVRKLADRNYEILISDPFHPSLHFKKSGRTRQLWSVRVEESNRAWGVEESEGIV